MGRINKISLRRQQRQRQQSTAGLDSARVLAITSSNKMSVYSGLDSLPSTGFSEGDKALVESDKSGNTRIYVAHGSGWYNKTLVNITPTWETEPNASYTVTDSATDLVITAKATDSDNGNLIWQGSASDSAQYLVNISRDSSVFTFDPLTADSVFANATAGNLDDSDGGDFIYTFKWSDGINFVSKAVTITYNGLAAWDGTLTATRAASGATAGASEGFYLNFNSSDISNVSHLISWRNALRSATPGSASTNGNLIVVFLNGNTVTHAVSGMNPNFFSGTDDFFGYNRVWEPYVSKQSWGWTLGFPYIGTGMNGSTTVDGTSYVFSTNNIAFNKVECYAESSASVTRSSDTPLYTIENVTNDSELELPYTSNLIFHADAANMTFDTARWYNMGSGASAASYVNGLTGTGMSLTEEGGSGPNNRAVFNGTTGTVWNPSTGVSMTPGSYTLFAVNGYAASSPTEKRILQSEGHNWLSGFWDGRAGVAFHGAWVTSGSNRQDYHGTDMFYMTDQQDLFRSNGNDRHNASGTTGAGSTINLRINAGQFSAEKSDFRMSELILYSAELTSAQINQVESYLATKYGM